MGEENSLPDIGIAAFSTLEGLGCILDTEAAVGDDRIGCCTYKCV